MAVLLRLLLALCLVATTVPAQMSLAAAATPPESADHADDLPPCHGGHAKPATDPAPTPDPHGCCPDGACDGGCGCLHASGLPIAPAPSSTTAIPGAPPSGAAHGGAPPRLSPPVRPPIA
jgi:hypothetical protein